MSVFRQVVAILSVILTAGIPGGLAATDSLPLDPSDGGYWLVKIQPGKDPEAVAESVGAIYGGPLRGVDNYHRFRFARQLESKPDQESSRITIRRQLEAERSVETYEEDIKLVRYLRSFVPPDPLFEDQWHLDNAGQTGGIPFADVQVRPAWDSGLSGAGSVIAIVDSGIEYTHPDLFANWLVGSGYDYNEEDNNPLPSFDDDRHGTSVAGIALAASNNLGGLGIAYNAKLVPLRLVAGSFYIGQEAEALSHRRQEVDIYSNSWGPSDDAGIYFSPISDVLASAFSSNIQYGRGGLGNIYVWAAGNGGLNGDNSNYDGYNASPYTISVGAVGHDDIKAGYSEPGANLLLVAPSGGRGSGITTTDNTGSSGYDDGDYYFNFSGTSAAAPMVTGVVALLLEERPDLSWRDVQQILAKSASPIDFSEDKWDLNGAGYWVSHDYGFGRVDANAAVRLARNWPLLGAQGRITESSFGSLPEFIDDSLIQTLEITTDIEIQHVLLSIISNHTDWGDLRIELVSPSGTVSVMSEPHLNVNEPGEPGSWTFLSTHCLGESSLGTWTLRMSDEGSRGSGLLTRWTVDLRGTESNPSANQVPVFEDLKIESVTYPLEIDVLEGVVDPEGDNIEILSTQMPRASQLEALGDGKYLFQMGATKDGTDVFSVLISDGQGAVRRRLVHVLDPRPVARNDLFTVESGFSGTLPVLSNDLDPNGDVLRLTGLSGSFSGEASPLASGDIQYASPEGFSGVERIQYFITDDSSGESSGWATVIVQPEAEIAVLLDGEDDHLRLDNRPELQMSDQFTAEAWIYPTSYGEYVTGFGRIYDRDTFALFLNGFDHNFYSDQSLVAYFVLDNGVSVAANTGEGTIQLDTWQHIAVSYDSANLTRPVRIYINGQPVSHNYPIPDTSAPRRPVRSNTQYPLYMGESDSGARAFAGRMSEFRIWDSVLTDQYILEHHDQRLAGSEVGLAFYLPLNQTLEPQAVNLGSTGGSATIFEAKRIPMELPWENLSRHYTLVQDSGSGWWLERTLGWIYGDLFPWIYMPSLTWAYTGHPAESADYLLWPLLDDWGWLQTRSGLYPWFFRSLNGDWIWYLEGTQEPSWFYSSELQDWLPGDAAYPEF